MEADKRTKPATYDVPGTSEAAPAGAPKRVGVYDQPTGISRFPKGAVWAIILVLLVVLAIIFLL